MEILKTPVSDSVLKLEIGASLTESNTLEGTIELDIENQNVFVDMVNSIFDEDHLLLIIDMQNISYIDSSGLWALFEGHKKALQKNGKLVLLKPSKDVKRVLDITKMSSKISVFESEAEAIQHLKA